MSGAPYISRNLRGDVSNPTDFPSCVFLCAGKSCSREDGFDKLCRRLDEEGVPVERMKCLGLCSGPVLAAAVGGKIRVVHKVRGKKRRERVVSALVTATHERLKPLLAKKGKGAKAARKVNQHLDRLSSGVAS